MARITKDELNQQLERLNRTVGEDKFEFERAYGGTKVVEVETGRDPMGTGYTTVKELYKALNSFILGVQYAKHQL